ncbi:sporulation protein Cse60 [Bacillus tianshenii]|nr:sporulation protein Cse60 [Bacillus tianshenii]
MLRVKIFDEQHEKDLEEVLNEFLATLNEQDVKDIQFQTSVATENEEEQVYCFAAMVVYRQ